MKTKTLCIIMLLIGLNYSIQAQTYINPVTRYTYYNLVNDHLKLDSVINNQTNTILKISYTNKYYEDGWFKISSNSFLEDPATGKKYKLQKAENIAISPKNTAIDHNQTKKFTLFFEKLPSSCKFFHFIEEELHSDNFKILNIDLTTKPIDYNPCLNELLLSMPEIILTFFTDGTSWPPYEAVYDNLRNQSANDSKLSNFSTTNQMHDDISGLDLAYYNFNFNNVKFHLEKNMTSKSNRLLIIECASELQLHRILVCLTKLLNLTKEQDGSYTFPNQLFSTIIKAPQNTLIYYSN